MFSYSIALKPFLENKGVCSSLYSSLCLTSVGGFLCYLRKHIYMCEIFREGQRDVFQKNKIVLANMLVCGKSISVHFVEFQVVYNW